MLKSFQFCIFSLLFSCLAASTALAEPAYAEGGASKCLSCHDFSSDSPVHAMLAGAHGNSDDDKSPMGQRGCEDCHGPSASHSKSPTQVAPAVSFGPRWSATIAAQDKQCLSCHEENVAQHWQDALHMVNDLTCVSCHDIHQDRDKVLFADSQTEVCTVCHKPQKTGIHGLQEHKGENPACTSCHNPHDDQSALGAMLDNRSEGCRSCHDLVAMSTAETVTEKAKSYHKVMAQQDRTCLDCHQSIAHNTAAGVAPLINEAVKQRTVTLFYPGQSDSEWLLTEHPGSQPLRQGSNCQQCHRGEEADMASALNEGDSPELRALRMSFDSDGSNLLLTLSWEGPRDDADIALMWGDNDSDAFRRGGCFAACHSDMPGMSKDRGQQVEKYLLASRAQQQRIGQPAIIKDDAALKDMLAAGNFVEMWRIQLSGDKAKVETAALLSGLSWQESQVLKASSQYADGRWTVSLQRPLITGDGHKNFVAQEKYTLGVALHGANNAGGKHWVSLPLTLSLDSNDTDFTTE
ncbi:MAG: cytochrome c3 family protein [Halioglobus sp.]